MSNLSLLAETSLRRTDSVLDPPFEDLGPEGGIEDLKDKIEDLENEVRDLGYAHGKIAAEMANANRQIRMLQRQLADAQAMTDLWRRRALDDCSGAPCAWCGAPGSMAALQSQDAEIVDVECVDEDNEESIGSAEHPIVIM